MQHHDLAGRSRAGLGENRAAPDRAIEIVIVTWGLQPTLRG